MTNKQKILIVDDDENIAELISLYLTKECFDTKMVHDGEMALVAFDVYPRYLPNVWKWHPRSVPIKKNIIYRCWIKGAKRKN